MAFTGSTNVAKLIKKNLIQNGNSRARVIAETGGLNAMVVDSTALSEQVTRDVIDSAFKSAGQRCSALRILLIQDDCYDTTISMIRGATKELILGNPQNLKTDCGPVINLNAKTKLLEHIKSSAIKNTVSLSSSNDLSNGHYVAPTIIELDNIDQINEEFFGPILHVIRYSTDSLMETIDKLNEKGYGLTFGVHSRIKNQVDQIVSRVNAGNIYVNRNQVGAIVGSQPFGGEGLSGTGPKAGGPHALHGYSRSVSTGRVSNQKLTLSDTTFNIGDIEMSSPMIDDDMVKKLRQEFSSLGGEFFNFLTETVESYSSIISLPGPTGESNELTYKAKGCALCFGPSETDSIKQTILALALGNSVISQINSKVFSSLVDIGFNKSSITRIEGMPSNEIFENNHYHAIMYFGDALSVERILENKREEIIPIVSSIYEPWQLIKERVISIDTTASGGNANLLAL